MRTKWIVPAMTAVLLLTVGIAGCGGDKLSRREALKMLREITEKNAPNDRGGRMTIYLPEVYRGRDGTSGQDAIRRYYKTLAERGMVTVVPTDCGIAGPCDVVVLTEAGQAAAVAWEKEAEPKPLFIDASPRDPKLREKFKYSVPVATPEVIDVTGIRLDTPSLATVTYRWKWKPTDFAWVSNKPIDQTPQDGVAQFSKYDDGWR